MKVLKIKQQVVANQLHILLQYNAEINKTGRKSLDHFRQNNQKVFHDSKMANQPSIALADSFSQNLIANRIRILAFSRF